MPRPVERNRHDDFGIGEELGTRRRHPPPEQGHALVAIPIFEALDQVAHGRGIARCGPRSVVDWRIGDGRSRKARLAGIVGKWMPSLMQSGEAMKSILGQQSPQSSPWAPARLRQEMQTGGSRRSAARFSAPRAACAAEKGPRHRRKNV